MGIRAVTRSQPEPKAVCPSCHRPVALLKLGKCVYCGAEIPGALQLVTTKPGKADLETPMPFASGGGGKLASRAVWLKRIFWYGAGSLLVGAFLGPCMKPH